MHQVVTRDSVSVVSPIKPRESGVLCFSSNKNATCEGGLNKIGVNYFKTSAVDLMRMQRVELMTLKTDLILEFTPEVSNKAKIGKPVLPVAVLTLVPQKITPPVPWPSESILNV